MQTLLIFLIISMHGSGFSASDGCSRNAASSLNVAISAWCPIRKQGKSGDVLIAVLAASESPLPGMLEHTGMLELTETS